MSSRHIVWRQLLGALATVGCLSAPCVAAEYYDQYGLAPKSPALDLGGQPLGYPSGTLSAVMAHDRLLGARLKALGHPLASHAFRRGADMVPLIGDQRLEAGLLGDMPTILSAATGASVIAGLVKQSSTALVARGQLQVQALAGKRIGYIEASSAHHTLLQGLAAAGLKETDVTLVNLRIDDMAPALERGEIDAFAGWEPAPSLALTASPQNRIVFRGLSTDYLVLNKAFTESAPKAALELIAGYLRAINWLRLSQRNIEQAARWTLADTEAFSGSKPSTTVAQLVAIARRDILDVPSAPAIVRHPGELPLHQQFTFLDRLGKLPHLPTAASLKNLAAAFAYDGLSKVSSAPRDYGLNQFDYAD
jgi:ABC-type nitrate/sulfonate/bicarbonate transport system substrate-binding protein